MTETTNTEIETASNGAIKTVRRPGRHRPDQVVAMHRNAWSPSPECALQADLDAWLVVYNEQRSHQGRWCYGKTPIETFIDMLPTAREKLMQAA